MYLLDEMLSAYGGKQQWDQITSIRITQTIAGSLWPRKNVEGILDGATVEIQPRHQRAWHRPLAWTGLRSSYSPDQVLIETDDEAATTVEALTSPRDSFAGHTAETPWNRLQLAYFAGYAMWTYLSEPYSLTLPGVHIEELGPWRENGHIWRRLGVRYPDSIATHSADQTLYIDSDGLIQRRDYRVDIAGRSLTAHYSTRHKQFGGIVLATERSAYRRGADGLIVPGMEPVVTIGVTSATVN